MDRFKYFLINEGRSYLGQKVSSVLTSLQDLTNDMENLGSRHVVRLSEEIVNQIRKILHSQWEVRYTKHLKELQKIAVAIQKTIEEKGDLDEILPSAVQSLQNLSGELGVKINNLQAPPEREGGQDVTQSDFQLTGDGQEEQPQDEPQASMAGEMPQQPQQMPQQQQQMQQQQQQQQPQQW